MAPPPSTAPVLREFLYRDPSRVSSLAAQVFGGLLTAVEWQRTTNNQDEWGLGLSGFFTGKNTQGGVEGDKRTYNPHDLLANDLVGKLTEMGFIRGDVANAPDGGLVHTSGSLEIGDDKMLRTVADLMSDSAMDELTRATRSRSFSEKGQAKAIGKLFQKLSFPTIYVITDSNGFQVGGPLKTAGMDEEPDSFFLKRGGFDIPNVHVLGVKESMRLLPPGDESKLFTTFGRQFASVFRDLLFPKGLTMVTPILLYREFQVTK
jgi:hypothetical protein